MGTMGGMSTYGIATSESTGDDQAPHKGAAPPAPPLVGGVVVAM